MRRRSCRTLGVINNDLKAECLISMQWPSKAMATPPKRICVAALVTVTSCICVGLSVNEVWSDLATALTVFLVSLSGFHLVAFLTFRCAICWRAVDYPWVLATIMAVIIAVTNIYDRSHKDALEAAYAERQLVYEDLINAIKTTVTNDCHPKTSRAGMWRAAPEPYDGGCDRIEHFLPQIENEAAREAASRKLAYGNAWGIDMLIEENAAVGSWAALYTVSRRFDSASERTQSVIEKIEGELAGRRITWLTGQNLKYWYFMLAYLLGLRIAKVTAELLALIPKEKSLETTEHPLLGSETGFNLGPDAVRIDQLAGAKDDT